VRKPESLQNDESRARREDTQEALQPLRWRCAECAIHHERDVLEE